MKEKLESIKKLAEEKVSKIQERQDLNDLKVKILGKKGELTEILRGMGSLSPEERPKMGSLVNSVRAEIETLINKKEQEIEEKELAKKLEDEKIDISLPGTKVKRGSKHPLNRVIEEVEDLFVSMGYDVVSGPEL